MLKHQRSTDHIFAKLLNIMPKSATLALGLVILVAAIFRLAFLIGFDGFDDVMYANSAQALTNGRFYLSLWDGEGRIGHYGPLALFYLLFGPSMATTLAWPFLCSLVTIVLLYRIVFLLAGQDAALLAAAFFALIPPAVSTATTNVPDVAMVMLGTAAVYAWMLARRAHGIRSAGLYLLCVLLLVWGVWANQRTVFTGAFLLGWSLLERHGARLAAWAEQLMRSGAKLGAGMALIVAVWYYGSQQSLAFPDALASTASDMFGQLSTSASFYIVFPIAVMVIVMTLRKPEPATRFAFAWFAFTFIALEWSPMSLNPMYYNPAPGRPIAARGILFLMLPLAALVGLWLAKLAPKGQAAQVLWLVYPVLGVAGLGTYLGLWDTPGLLAVSSLAVLLFVALSLLLPGRIQGQQAAYLAVLLLAFGLAIVNPVQKAVEFSYERRAYFRNLELTAALVEEYPETQLYFLNQEDTRALNHLNFVSGYVLAPDPFDELSGRMQFITQVDQVTAGSLVIVLQPSLLQEVEPTWRQIAHFEQPATPIVANPPQVYVFEVDASP